MIEWACNYLPVDKGRIYLKGTSANGYGALLTAAMIPEKIAAVYATVEPITIGPSGTIFKQMWGSDNEKLNSDIDNWLTGDPLSINDLTDMRIIMNVNELRDLPLIFDVHGKNDHTAGWSAGKIEWFDSLQANHAGGVFFWDQRSHGGGGSDFTNEETTPDFYRYRTDRSYPAFSNCSIDQNPGNGSKNSGDPYGAFNGYLEWNDDMTDEECLYKVISSLKIFMLAACCIPISIIPAQRILVSVVSRISIQQ
jgi:hypothetical protein